MKLISNFSIFVLMVKVQFSENALISNVNFPFETFSPKSLIRFFEFNDFSYNISQLCIRDLYLYLDALQKDLRWSYRLLDASGNYAGGFFYGQLLRLSNPRQCDELNEELNFLLLGINQNSTLHPNDTDIVPFFVQNVNAKYQTYFANKRYEIHQTICMPITCNFEDLSTVLSYVSLDPDNIFLENTELIEIRVLYQNYKFHTDINFYIIVSLASVVFLFNVGISIHESYVRFSKRSSNEKYKRNISCHPEINLTGGSKCSSNSAGSKMSGETNEKTKIICKHDVICKQHCKNKTKNYQMPDDAEKMTISSKNCNHVNLVKLHKNKSENTITLDIISANVFQCQKKKRSDLRHRFSLQNQLNLPSDTPFKSDSTSGIIPGIRAFSLFWLVLLNVTTFLSYVANNRKFLVNKETNWIIHLIFKNGSFAIDSFFFINGFLLCEIFFKSSKDLGVHNIKCVEKQIKHFFCVLLYKFLRIVLPYAVLLQSLKITMKHFNEHSVLSVPSNDHFTCDNIISSNLLFIDTFTETNQRCGLFTWFMSLEMLYFAISLLVLMISRNHPRFGITIFVSFYISTFFISTANQVSANQFHQISDLNDVEKLSHLNGMYDGFLVYLGPYLVGILFGVCRFNFTGKVKINPIVLILGFTSSTILIVLLTFGTFNLSTMNVWLKQSFLNMSHLFWGFILLWMSFVSVSDIGDYLNGIFSSKIFHVISKISNSCLLIHPLIIRWIILGSNTPIFISVELIVMAFFGLLTMTILLGLIFHILFEAPVLILLQIIYEKLVQKSKKLSLR